MSNTFEDRLGRYTCAMRNEKADMIPLRPFAAELTGLFGNKNCQQMTHDYNEAFEAVISFCKEFEFDAVVPNMVYVWTGLTQALGLKYYGIPGIDIKKEVAFQYLEPSEEESFMKEDEYDELIDDPTAFLYNKWLPRVSTKIASGTKEKNSLYTNNLALVKSSMAMLGYFNAFGAQCQRMKDETQTPCAIAGIFKAPLDILADKLRGYLGLTMDIIEQPEKVLKACEALMPHLCNTGLSSADPSKTLPIAFWMHRGCKPFVSDGIFESMYWATTKPIIEEFYRNGHQTLFYAEGDWKFHLDSFRELPDASIIYHVDKGDIFDVHKKLGDKFCISGGIPNVTLAFKKENDVREICKKVIKEVGQDGGYIMDASAIMQNEINPNNIRAMYETCKEFGVYSQGSLKPKTPLGDKDLNSATGFGNRRAEISRARVSVDWETEKRNMGKEILGDELICKNIWENVESFATTYIWQILLSF